ncbi:Aminoglycoside phosphotransferase family protein [Pararobbsia alpina]|uniref:aminoglycoside phosphotransferase family protein n=1 Tax=Pararobbsia alpina TaxID=621374 RepID=UPI0039A7298C
MSVSGMIDTPSDARAALLESLGIEAPWHAETIGHGRNSRVERIGNARGEWILKRYHAGGPQSRDRLGTEYAFLGYLNAQGVASVARPVGLDREAHLAVYTKLTGTRIAAITDDAVSQAAAFICDINAHTASPQAGALPMAADACASWGDHLALVRARIAQLGQIEPASDVERDARHFVERTLAPAWQAIEATLIAHPSAADRVTPILSPSDFGFHNALDDHGTLSFVDFEYAGWDDPAKLACDFICQPELPVGHAQGMQFVDVIAQHLAPRTTFVERVSLLLPVHRLKWCCILLNEFRAEHRARRLHAGVSSEDLLAVQLDKARRYFARHIGSTQE